MPQVCHRVPRECGIYDIIPYMDRAAFTESVRDALTNLYDRTYLAKHTLAADLPEHRASLSGDLLHQLLLDAIAQLRPAPNSPSTSAGWRRYRYLDLRYREGWSHKAAAHELGLSIRQAHRVRSEALEAIGTILGKSGASGPPTRGQIEDKPVSAIPRPAPASLAAQATLDDEIARLGREEPDAPADLAQEVHAALEILAPLSAERRARINVELPADNQVLAAGRGLLRHTLLLLLGYGLEHQIDQEVYLTVDPGDEGVNVDIVFARISDAPSLTVPSLDPRLIAAQRLAGTQGGSLEVIDGEGHCCLRLTLQPRKQYTVLTIDDNPDLGQLFEAFLQSSRFHLIRAKTAQTALRLAEEARPDIVTLDVMMPFCDGWEVFRQLRARPATQTIPVIICSILPERDLALALGANDFLAKPVTRQSLITTLNRSLPA